jgi:hypothetical protein
MASHSRAVKPFDLLGLSYVSRWSKYVKRRALRCDYVFCLFDEVIRMPIPPSWMATARTSPDTVHSRWLTMPKPSNANRHLNVNRLWSIVINNLVPSTFDNLFSDITDILNIVACFANARTVEARSLETGAQQKKNECL